MFKFLIEGKTIKELKANVEEFFEEFEALKPRVEQTISQDFLTKIAAEQPSLPKEEAVEPARSIPVVPAPASIPKESGSATSAPATPNDYGVDSRGLPWDERIHSVTQAKVKDGTWRYKRGVEDPQIKQVEQELISRIKGTQAAEMTPPPVSIPVVPPVPAPAPLVVPPVPVAVVAPPPPMPPPQPAVPSAHSLKTFKETLIPTLAKLVKDGKLTQEYINSLCSHYQVDMIHKVNDQQLAEMFEGFVQYGMVTKAE